MRIESSLATKYMFASSAAVAKVAVIALLAMLTFSSFNVANAQGTDPSVLELSGQVEDFVVYVDSEGKYSAVRVSTKEEFSLEGVTSVTLVDINQTYDIATVQSVAVPKPDEPVILELSGQVEDFAVYVDEDGVYTAVRLSTGEVYELAGLDGVRLTDIGETYDMDTVRSVAVPKPDEPGPFDGISPFENIAAGKTATQSSVIYNGVPSKAVDRNSNSSWGGGSITHTNNELNPWWQVDLGGSADMRSVRLYNRTDCCSNRLSNFYIFISETDLTGRSFNDILADDSVTRIYTQGQAPNVLTLSDPGKGQFVRVQLAGTNVLSLAEVQVYLKATDEDTGDDEFAGRILSFAARHSGKCIDIKNASSATGADAQQWNCHAAPHEQFGAEKIGIYYQLRAEHSGLCLEVTNGSTANGAVVQQGQCLEEPYQLWSLEESALGTYIIRASHSNKCMNVYGASTRNGAGIIQWDCMSPGQVTPSANNLWFIWNKKPNGALGRWEGPFRTPVVAGAAAALPDGNVLMWSSATQYDYLYDGSKTYTSIFNPATKQSSLTLMSNTQHDMFCPGISTLADGRIVVTGGKNGVNTSIFDPAAGNWRRAANMNIGRGYQSSATDANGSIFTVGGSWRDGRFEKGGELFTNGIWSRLNNVQSAPMNTRDSAGVYRADNHMWLFSAPNGKIFHAGPSYRMHWIGTDGNGDQTYEGNRGSNDAMNGTAVLYDVGKILATGGAGNYDNGGALQTAYSIDLNGGIGAVVTKRLANPAYARTLHSSVVLPNGEVVIIGGQSSAALFTDNQGVLAAEIWNPETEEFRIAASMRVPRTYHSAAVLLKDGRVWVGGGGQCGGCEANHPDAEIFYPPYLLNEDGSLRDRPVITLSPASSFHGATIRVEVTGGATSFALVRLGSATHAVNTDQRRIPVSATNVGSGAFDIQIPTNRGSLIPGNYFLFAMDADGTPSVAETINIQ